MKVKCEVDKQKQTKKQFQNKRFKKSKTGPIICSSITLEWNFALHCQKCIQVMMSAKKGRNGPNTDRKRPKKLAKKVPFLASFLKHCCLQPSQPKPSKAKWNKINHVSTCFNMKLRMYTCDKSVWTKKYDWVSI